MKVLVDACVLYPTVLREIVLDVAKTGYFEPLWSERILEEWRRAALRNGHPEIADSEVAAARRASWPSAASGSSIIGTCVMTYSSAQFRMVFLP